MTASPLTDAHTNAPSLMRLLKQDTRSAHDRVEQIPYSIAIMDKSVSLERYIAQLHAWHTFMTALEDTLDAHAARDPRIAALWDPTTQTKSPWLEKDILALDPEHALADTDAARAARQYASAIGELDSLELLGHLYVHDGSGLGGLVLVKYLAEALGIERAGLRYHRGHGRATIELWRGFSARMDALITLETEHERVLKGANDAFDATSEILTALG